MAKTYYVSFGPGDPRPNFGLAPTFLIFNNNGTSVTPPAISAVTGATGFYSFAYGTTTPIVFLLDGFTTGLGNYRYVQGNIDPADRADEYGNTLIAYGQTTIALGTTTVAQGTTQAAIGSTLAAIGTTQIAISVTLSAISSSLAVGVAAIGTTASTFGDSTTDPTTLFGLIKRVQELYEGDNYFFKLSGSFTQYTRGSSTLLRTKTITNGVSTITRTGV